MSSKTALIVGGGSGMGAAAARKLAENGFGVAILTSSGKGEALAAELGGLSFTGSNRNPDDLKRFVDLAMDGSGALMPWSIPPGTDPKGRSFDQ